MVRFCLKGTTAQKLDARHRVFHDGIIEPFCGVAF